MGITQMIDTGELRRAFGTFVTGVTVITTLDTDGVPRGMTANSFTSVSLDPPLLLICVGKSASSYEAFAQSDAFAVNILHEGQIDVSAAFASKSPDKFRNVDFDAVHTGAPVLTDSLSWFDCTVFNRIDAGDHLVLIGQVQAFGTTPAAPLGFRRGRYASVRHPLPEGWVSSQTMIVGYLIERDGSILLRQDKSGAYFLPTVATRKSGRRLVLEDGAAVNVTPDRTFLYSVFDVADDGPGYLIYRASLEASEAESALPESLKFHAMDDLPIDLVAGREQKAVLRRYARERSAEQFGIYMDSRDGGRVAMIEREGAYSA